MVIKLGLRQTPVHIAIITHQCVRVASRLTARLVSTDYIPGVGGTWFLSPQQPRRDAHHLMHRVDVFMTDPVAKLMISRLIAVKGKLAVLSRTVRFYVSLRKPTFCCSVAIASV